MERGTALAALVFAGFSSVFMSFSANPAYAGEAGANDSGELALTPVDISLYLQTMHAAADRVRHPTKEEADLLRRAKASMASTAANPGKPVVPDFDALDRLTYFQGGMVDTLIVEQKPLNRDRYDRIVRAVEDAVPSPNEAIGDGGGLSTPYVPTAEDRARQAILDANKKMLKSDIQEIHSLEAIVRKMTSS